MIKLTVKKIFSKTKSRKNFLKPLFTNNKQFKSSDINILLNRVKLNEKIEFRRKVYSILISLLGITFFAFIFLK
tara:strand:+ start:240 stop:461 length:222 start_codon:yes stop_codon:yes gene_type:complete